MDQFCTVDVEGEAPKCKSMRVQTGCRSKARQGITHLGNPGNPGLGNTPKVCNTEQY